MKPPVWLVILAVSSGLAAAAAEEGFTELFNGRDLSGWKNVNCAPETWTWKDGVLHCTGRPIGALRTERRYENFILECEWRHLKSGGNAGIFLWASPIAAPGVPFLRAIEVQVLDEGYGQSEWYTTHGDVFPIHGSTMEPFGRHRGMRSFPSEERSRPSPQWNHYRIVCTNGVVRLHVNGKEVSGGENCNWRRGYIGLESEGSPVEFRDVRLMELPGSGVDAEHSAPPDPGWRSLYNGVDLRNWNPGEAAGSRWQPHGWKLSNPGGEERGKSLWTREKFGDFELIWDCRPADPPSRSGPVAAILLRGVEEPAARVELGPTGEGDGDGPLAIAALQVGEWRRFSLIVAGRKVTLRADKSEPVHAILPDGVPARGSLGLMDTGNKLEFANLYVRDLHVE